MTTTRLIENLSEFSKTVSVVLCLSAVTIFQRFRKPWHHRQYQQHKPTRKEEEEEATKITTSDRSRSVAMQFKVVVPEECSEGETFRVILADGTEANVTIPEGLSGGDTFVFEVPTNQMKNPGQLVRDFERHQKEQQQQKEEEQHKQQQQQQQQQPKSLKQSKSSKRKQKKHQPNNPNAHPITEIETITHHHHPNDVGDSDGIPTTTASLLFHEEGSGGDGDNPSGGPPTKPGGEDPGARRPVGAALAGTIHFEDFLPALAVGLLVGSGIVVGFLAGILHATEAIYAVHPIEKPKQSQRQRQRQLQQKSSPIQPGDLPASALPSEMG